MQMVLYLALHLTVKAVDVQGSSSLESRVLKRVYGKRHSMNQCRELCERQKSPLCADLQIIGGVCTLLAPVGVYNLLRRKCFISDHEYECPAEFSYKYPENPLKTSFNTLPSCYVFGRKRLTWEMSRKACKDLGGYLVNIETLGESEHLDAIIKHYTDLQKPEMLNVGDWAYWAGGSDIRDEGNWIWMTSGVSFKFTKWNPGQPDNHKGREHCLQLRRELDWRWNDNPCFGAFYGFICEAEAKKI